MRLKSFLQSSIFDRLKEENPSVLNKIEAITGDITEENLGISDENRNILTDEVNIIFNSAASLNFNEELTKSVQTNLGM